MAHRVDPTVNPVESATADSSRNRASKHAQRVELGSAHNPVLAGGERRDRDVGRD
jgi:hypothetical protein